LQKEVGFPISRSIFYRFTYPMRRVSACPCAASAMGSSLGLSGQPARAEANGALHLAVHSGRATGVAGNPGILVRVPRDAAAANLAVRVDLETKTRLCRIGLIRPATAHATCKRARPPCGLVFGCAHMPILIKNVLHRLAGKKFSCAGSPSSCCSRRPPMPKP